MDEVRARQLVGQEIERVGKLMAEVRHDVGDGSEGDELSELSVADQHPADIGTETFEREKDLSLLDSLERELRDLEKAMERIDDGTYGVCRACETAIPEERLEAVPGTRFCVEHEPTR